MPAGARSTLAGEVAIVTGASSGIGAATARELARRGSSVVLAARRAQALENEARAIRRDGGRATVIPTDVSEPSEVTRLVAETLTSFGRVDVLVNNAGASWQRAFASTSPQQVVDIVGVNLLGAVLLTRAVLPGMLARRHGAIVSVGSVSGRVAMEPIYSATKYGLRGFSLALRRQLAGTGVSVSLISPGNINTGMTRHVRARMPEPEAVSLKIAALVTTPRREVVVPPKHYAIAFMEQFAPGVTDHVYRWRGWSPVREEESA